VGEVSVGASEPNLAQVRWWGEPPPWV
jgi:hypothetical protein